MSRNLQARQPTRSSRLRAVSRKIEKAPLIIWPSDMPHAINEARTPVGHGHDHRPRPGCGADRRDPCAIDAAVSKVGEIHHQTAGALEGGLPEPMLRRLDAIRQVLTMVAPARQYREAACRDGPGESAAGRCGGKLNRGAGVPVQDRRHPRSPT